MMRGLRAALFFRDPLQRVRHSARMPIRFCASHTRTRLVATLLVLFSSAAAPASPPREFKLATWNLEWFMTPETLRALTPACMPADAPRDGARRAVPCDVAHELARSREDIAALRRHARALDADVVALQEVDGSGGRAAGVPRLPVLFLGARRGAEQWLRDPPRPAVCLRSGPQRTFR